ncbi:unnamed protein product [Penicillium olsonii]|uniref:Uncharacterized protein n=1 Tax=Penicillium olsonii TaxID=99116 RepID=A0A9W4HKA1_PENOL|nr:unnamed protein product [Penicillium olsonii]CAG8044981.1 unnamed protein product [Penicillium olsonii]CAG8064448.1 unnamed protein product [Penicillium olsonii]
MARFSLSFLAVLFVLAAVALSVPVKRDEGKAAAFSLESALGPLEGATKLIPGLDKDDGKPKLTAEEKKQKKEQEEEQQKKDDEATIAKANKKIAEADGDAKPTPTATHKNKVSSGNFVTPSATPTHKAKSKPNSLSKIPIIGGILGGSGVGL